MRTWILGLLLFTVTVLAGDAGIGSSVRSFGREITCAADIAMPSIPTTDSDGTLVRLAKAKSLCLHHDVGARR
jgi:hypothetical protein